MNRGTAAHAALALAALILQSVVFPHLQVAHVRPDLLLVLCVLSGLAHGPRGGAVTGFWVGLGQDLLAGRFLGLFILSKVTMGAFGGFAAQRVYRDRLVVPALACLVGTILQRLVIIAVMQTAGIRAVASPWQGALWAEALLNGLAGIVLFNVLTRLDRRLGHASA